MAENNNSNLTNPTNSADPNPYQDALFAAWNELSALQEEEKKLIIKKARLKQTCDALWPMAFPDDEYPDINAMSLADAIRLMVQAWCNSDRSITVKEVKGKLQDIGYDLSKYKNPLASIHTAANRMVESGELRWMNEEDNKLVPTPDMKQVLTTEPDTTTLQGMIGENAAGQE